jgi:hypothetical protein
MPTLDLLSTAGHHDGEALCRQRCHKSGPGLRGSERNCAPGRDRTCDQVLRSCQTVNGVQHAVSSVARGAEVPQLSGHCSRPNPWPVRQTAAMSSEQTDDRRPSRYMSLQEVADEWRLKSTGSVRNKIYAGELLGVNVATVGKSQLRVTRASFFAYCERIEAEAEQRFRPHY